MPLLVFDDMENALRGFDPCTCPMRNASRWRVLTLCCLDAEVGAGGELGASAGGRFLGKALKKDSYYLDVPGS